MGEGKTAILHVAEEWAGLDLNPAFWEANAGTGWRRIALCGHGTRGCNGRINACGGQIGDARYVAMC